VRRLSGMRACYCEALFERLEEARRLWNVLGMGLKRARFRIEQPLEAGEGCVSWQLRELDYGRDARVQIEYGSGHGEGIRSRSRRRGWAFSSPERGRTESGDNSSLGQAV
jgi:hypothetical protein